MNNLLRYLQTVKWNSALHGEFICKGHISNHICFIWSAVLTLIVDINIYLKWQYSCFAGSCQFGGKKWDYLRMKNMVTGSPEGQQSVVLTFNSLGSSSPCLVTVRRVPGPASSEFNWQQNSFWEVLFSCMSLGVCWLNLDWDFPDQHLGLLLHSGAIRPCFGVACGELVLVSVCSLHSHPL